jgi:hypothetical protein
VVAEYDDSLPCDRVHLERHALFFIMPEARMAIVTELFYL